MEATTIMLPKYDVVFKMLFGDKRNIRILEHFLKSILTVDFEEYSHITIVDPVLKRETPDDKASVVDVNLTTKSGKIIHIEMQVADKKNMRERMVYLNSKLLVSQLKVSDQYESLKRTISIVIADFDLIPEIQNRYHHVFKLRDERTGVIFSDLIEINALELQKIPAETDNSAEYDWLSFLKAGTEEELEMAAARNSVVSEAYAELKHLSEDENNRLLYEARVKRLRDEQAERALAFDRGKAEGKAEGELDGIRKVVHSMMAHGFKANQISEITGLTVQEIEAL